MSIFQFPGGGGVRKFLSFFGAHGHWGVALFLSTDIHTQDRLDESRSALARARLKIGTKQPSNVENLEKNWSADPYWSRHPPPTPAHPAGNPGFAID